MSDWSSDVCSSDLPPRLQRRRARHHRRTAPDLGRPAAAAPEPQRGRHRDRHRGQPDHQGARGVLRITELRPSLARRSVAAIILLAFSLSTAGLAGAALGVEVENPFEPDRTVVVAEFERAVGLYEQSRVFADGVEVGEVTSIDVQPDRVLVELHIDDITIKADTEAILRLRSLIGERYVELTDVWTGEGDQLKSDDVIPLDRTVVPAENPDVPDEAARVSKELDGATLNRVIEELAVVVGNDRSEEHTSELQSLMRISYAVFCLKKK